MSVIEWVYSARTVEVLFYPIYSDYLLEQVADTRRPVRALWRRLCFYGHVAKAAGLFPVSRLGKLLYEIWKMA